MKHANNAVLIIEYTVTPIRADLVVGANIINTTNIIHIHKISQFLSYYILFDLHFTPKTYK